MKRWVFILLCAFFLLFSLGPTFYEIRHQNMLRPERQFELVHNFYTDFNFYLSRIREGLDGRWTVIEKYTNEPHQGSYIHILYLLMGQVGRWVRVPYFRASDIYHMARVLLGFVLLVGFVQMAKRSFASFKWQIFAFLLAVTASTYPKFVMWNGNWRIGGYMPWWSVMDSLQRITFIPHLLAGQALMLFLILALSSTDTMKRPGNWFFLGILAFILGIIFPPGLIFVVATVGMVIVLEFFYDIRSIKKKEYASWIARHIVSRVVALGIAFPSFMYLTLMTSFYPWKRLAELDVIHPLPFQYKEYLLAMGIVLPLGVIGLCIALIRKERRLFAAIGWVFAWAILLVVFHWVPQQSPLRFSEMVPHVPLGILTAYLFFMLVQFMSRAFLSFFRDVRRSPQSLQKNISSSLSEIPTTRWVEQYLAQMGRNLAALKKAKPPVFISIFLTGLMYFILAGLLVLNMLHMYSSYFWQTDFVDHKMVAAYPLVPTGSYVMYPLKDFLSGMYVIKDRSTPHSVVLAETTAGNYVPVYAGTRTYVGHDNTVNAEAKREWTRQFFGGIMPQDVAYAWIKKEGIDFVFFGPQEREDGGVQDIQKLYPFLVEIMRNDQVVVYGVK